jgi:hypothetical protein
MLTLDILPPLFDVLKVMDMLALGNIDTIFAGKDSVYTTSQQTCLGQQAQQVEAVWTSHQYVN